MVISRTDPFRIFDHERMEKIGCRNGEIDLALAALVPSQDVRLVLRAASSVPVREHFPNEPLRHIDRNHVGMLQPILPVMRIGVEVVEPGELEGEVPRVGRLEISLLSRLAVLHVLRFEKMASVGDEFPRSEFRQVVDDSPERDPEAATPDEDPPLVTDYIG